VRLLSWTSPIGVREMTLVIVGRLTACFTTRLCRRMWCWTESRKTPCLPSSSMSATYAEKCRPSTAYWCAHILWPASGLVKMKVVPRWKSPLPMSPWAIPIFWNGTMERAKPSAVLTCRHRSTRLLIPRSPNTPSLYEPPMNVEPILYPKPSPSIRPMWKHLSKWTPCEAAILWNCN
jgi:hypothetical protein